jgi:chemotaxis-related protein WspD
MKNPLLDQGITDCWNHIGVTGDRSCPELSTVIHCKNCQVYTSAGRELLNREPPLEYLQEWSERLARPKEDQQTDLLSVVIFRLISSYFALDTRCFREVTEPAAVHRVPHRANKILKGIVNIRGEVHLCVSLTDLLGFEHQRSSGNRLIVIEKAGDRWAFPVDQVCGIYRIDRKQLSGSGEAKKTFSWETNEVEYLNSDLLFVELKTGVR